MQMHLLRLSPARTPSGRRPGPLPQPVMRRGRSTITTPKADFAIGEKAVTKRTIPEYLKYGEQLSEAVNAYRAARGEATVTQDPERSGRDVTSSTKPKSYQLPPAAGPTPIDGYPFNLSPPKEAPDYRTMQTAQIVFRARKAKGRSLLAAIGPSELRKRDSVSPSGTQDHRQ
jgi:hypothetical protein